MARGLKALEIKPEFVNEVAVKLAEPLEQFVYFRIIGACVEHRLFAFRIGSRPMTMAEISILTCVDKPNLETILPQLVKQGLIELESDNAFCFAPIKAQLHRSEVNRANGLKGGRPQGSRVKKNETSDRFPTAKLSSIDNKLSISSSWRKGEENYEGFVQRIVNLTGLDRDDAAMDWALSRWLHEAGDQPDQIEATLRKKWPPPNKVRRLWWLEPALAETMGRPRMKGALPGGRRGMGV